jgi:hypothetical protein
VRPVSDRFLAAVRGSHRIASQALAVEGGQTGVEPSNTVELDLIDGDVRFDAKAQIRSTLSLTVNGAGLFPRAASDLLAPFGNEIYVRRGLDYGGGQLEYVGLGYFRIDSVEQEEGPDGPILIGASDRMSWLIDARLPVPEQFGPAWTNGEVIDYLLINAVGTGVVEWDDSAVEGAPIGRTMLAEEDRWQFMDDLVTSLGKIWYFDHRGVLVVKDPPDATTPVWTCDSGAGGVMIQMSRDLSREGVYNGVAVTSEAFDSDVPFRALAVDGDPASPTYWYGDFGRIPRFFSSPFITNLGQAQAAAESLLRQNLGLPYSVDFTQVPNPALEPWDPIAVRIGSRTELHVIETLVVPLTAMSPQTGTTRQQASVLIGEA